MTGKTDGMKVVKVGMVAVIALLVVTLVYFAGVSTPVSREEKAAIHLSLAMLYNSKGEVDKAIGEIEKATVICPECDFAYSVLGDVYFYLRDYNKSLQSYEKALALKEDHEHYFDIGNAYYKMGMLEEALKQYKRVVELSPDASNAYLNIANILFDLERLPESKIYYDKVLEMDYYNPNAHNDIGVYYEKIGETGKAREEYETALEINPDNAIAQRNLERLGGG